ncbi:MAG: transposase [Dehalococcoidia bacterium]|nr:transposase [Dehalococcoidia bacterium]
MNNRYDLNQPRRKPIRLKGYDYSRVGAYFITIVAQGRMCLFGDVVDGEMRLNDAGMMVRRVWDGMPDRFPHIEMDEFVVMPNHGHGVIVIQQSPGENSAHPPVGASLVGAQSPTNIHSDTRATTRVAPTLGDVVGAFKSLTTLEYGRGVRETGWPSFDKRLWQRNYYEHIIRNDKEWNMVREYINDNPARWETDSENPDAIL